MNVNLLDLNSFFGNFTFLFWAKLFFLTFTFFYVVLAAVTLRQTQLMSEILNEISFSRFLKFLAVLHLFLAIGIFILAVLVA